MTATRAQVVAAARSWDGVPFRHLGRNRHGIDCLGLAVLVCKDLGLSSYDLRAYPRRPDHAAFLRHIREAGGIQIPVLAVRPADLLAMKSDRFPCHITIVTEKNGILYIIHAYEPRGKVLEEPLTAEWQKQRVAAFAIPGVI